MPSCDFIVHGLNDGIMFGFLGASVFVHTSLSYEPVMKNILLRETEKNCLEIKSSCFSFP